ncbi:MAG: histidine ammonia-lyase [Firmicutes bacterium]|nr:histidine ammonia-lyase [Bacillota bacterium]
MTVKRFETQASAVGQAREVRIGDASLTLTDVWQVARGGATVVLADSARAGVRASRERVAAAVARGRPVYGVNTGFGKLADVPVSAQDTALLQRNLIRSHACAVGAPASRDVVRAMMLLRAHALARGYSGVREETLTLLVECLNAGVTPRVPEQGSLGASGDLAPLAHLALVLMGEGEASVDGDFMPGAAALAQVGLEAVELDAKEGLALINGTQYMTAIGSLALIRAQRLAEAADAACALSFEAARAIRDALAPELHTLRPHPGQAAAAANLRTWLQGSGRTTAQGQVRVQDAYSLRCAPQVHGATRQVLAHVQDVLVTEMSAVTDNPLVLEDGRILSCGHFHGQPVALALDYLKIGVSELANISERRTERLVNPALSGLPAFLARDPGLSSGLMIVQYVAASLVSENKVLAHPASVDSIPSSAGQEDHVSMGATAARQAYVITDNVARVLAIELICAAQAIDLQGASDQLAPRTRALYAQVRARSPQVREDRSLAGDIERVAAFVIDPNLKLAEVSS